MSLLILNPSTNLRLFDMPFSMALLPKHSQQSDKENFYGTIAMFS